MDVWVFIKVAVQALPEIIQLELPNRYHEGKSGNRYLQSLS